MYVCMCRGKVAMLRSDSHRAGLQQCQKQYYLFSCVYANSSAYCPHMWGLYSLCTHSQLQPRLRTPTTPCPILSICHVTVQTVTVSRVTVSLCSMSSLHFSRAAASCIYILLITYTLQPWRSDTSAPDFRKPHLPLYVNATQALLLAQAALTSSRPLHTCRQRTAQWVKPGHTTHTHRAHRA